MSEAKTFHVLIVEDGLTSLEIIKDGVRSLPCPVEMHICKTGDEAMAFFEECEKNPEATKVDFVVLDLELPGPHGLEILRKIKTSEKLKDIVVAVNTGSPKFEYMREVKQWEGVSYMRKGFGNSKAVYDEIIRLRPDVQFFGSNP